MILTLTCTLTIVFSLFFCVSLHAADAYQEYREKASQSIEKITEEIPLSRWHKDLAEYRDVLQKWKTELDLDPLRSVKKIPYKDILEMKDNLGKSQRWIDPTEKNRLALESESLLKVIQKKLKPKSQEEMRAFFQLRESIQNEEFERTKWHPLLKKRVDLLQKWLDEFEAEWLTQYSRAVLFTAVNERLEDAEFSKLPAWMQQIDSEMDAVSAKKGEKSDIKQQNSLQKVIEKKLNQLQNTRQNLELDALRQMMEKRTHKDGVKPPAEKNQVMEQMLTRITTQNRALLDSRLASVQSLMDKCQEIPTAWQAREQSKIDLKQKKKAFEAYLTNLTQASDSTDSILPSVDAYIKEKPKSGKHSSIKSARNKLDVHVEQFDKSWVDTTSQDLSKLEVKTTFSSLNAREKRLHSLFAYTPKNGLNMAALSDFCNQVGLLSFGGGNGFVSYRVPANWNPATTVSWERDQEKDENVNYDRNYSYVDLVTSAHHESERAIYTEGETKTKVIPNLFIVFTPDGGIKRIESFVDIRKLKLSPDDLTSGVLYYKFLRYEVDGPSIQLLGIDHEMKSSRLTSATPKEEF